MASLEQELNALYRQGDLYDEINNFSYDLPFWLEKAQSANGPVLECCCGTGRLTIPLQEAGIEITGMDLLPGMLEHARKKAAAKGMELDLHQADLRDFDLGRQFSLVFVPYSSFQHMHTLDDVERAFTCLRKHMAPEATLIIDLFNPNIHFLAEGEGKMRECYRFTTDDGRKVVVSEVIHYNAITQTNEAKWHYQIDGKTTIEELNVRCFYPLEFQALLKYNGFRIKDIFGNFKGVPLQEDSRRMIYWCQ